MGILDFMGHVAGKMAAMGKEAMEYKKEYEHMSNQQLERELADLSKRGGREVLCRRTAISSILQERKGE